MAQTYRKTGKTYWGGESASRGTWGSDNTAPLASRSSSAWTADDTIVNFGAGADTPFDPNGMPKRFYTDSLWTFLLEELPGHRTRLVVGGRWAVRPKWLQGIVASLLVEPSTWVMHGRTFDRYHADPAGHGSQWTRRLVCDILSSLLYVAANVLTVILHPGYRATRGTHGDLYAIGDPMRRGGCR